MGVNTMINLVNLANISSSSERKRVNIVWINGCSDEKEVQNVEFISHGAIVELTITDNVHEYIPIVQMMKMTVTRY